MPITWQNKYFVQPQLFLIYDAAVSSYFARKKNTALSELRCLSDDKNLNLNATIGVGLGRMEDVTDARQAIYILEALKENKVLSNNIDAAKINEFAKVISTVKDKRFLDARLHKIDELTTVDKFLKDNNLLTSSDISYFTALNDMWEYGDLFERKYGHEMWIRNISGYQWLRNKRYENQLGYVNDYYTTTYSFTNKIAFGFEYSKPIKLNWQHDFSSSLTVNFLQENRYNSALDVNTKNKPPMVVSTNTEYRLGYYPNTRTNIYIRTVAGYMPSAYNSGAEKRLDSQLYFGANLGSYYYFSPNLRLSANAYIGNNTYLHLNKITDYKDVGNSFRAGFDITFTYSFF